MRQFVGMFLSFAALAAFAQPPAASTETTANKGVEEAQQELQKIKELVDAGALPRLRIDQAQRNLEDAQDEAILERTLFGELPAAEASDNKLMDDMVAAAQRRVERQQDRVNEAARLVANGLDSQASLTPLQEELAIRRMNLNLAHSRASLVAEMAALAKYQKTAAEIHETTSIVYRDSYTGGMEHYAGTGLFRESRDLKPLAAAFEKKFDRRLPISAEGETELHRALGFDHRGRVDVAVSPNAPEGIWLLRYLKSRQIPFYAFTRAIPGRATAAHIHIGPGSTRLHNTAAD